MWVDTSNSPGVCDDRDTSRYNTREVQLVSALVDRLNERDETLLVLSPYAAQQQDLYTQCPRAVVKTIDGCQGFTADTTIVSFVTLDFTKKMAFVADARRMTVALSRARKRLYLVGSLAQLRASVRATGNRYPHMAGLLELSADHDVMEIVPAEAIDAIGARS